MATDLDLESRKRRMHSDSDDDGKIVCIFTAPWISEPCQRIVSFLENLAKQTQGFKTREISVDRDSGQADAHGVSVIPTVQFFKTEADLEALKFWVPPGAQKPWSQSGLIGAHLDEIRKALLVFGVHQFTTEATVEGEMSSQFGTSQETLISWSAVQEKYEDMLNDVTDRLYKGIEPEELENDDFVKYHHRSGLNSFLSENYPCKFFYDNEMWQSLQHAYQAAKFNKEAGAEIRRWILEAEEPQEAKRIGADFYRKPFSRTDFYSNDTNLEIMFHVALAKFQQNPRLGKWLLETEPDDKVRPIFHVESDKFWGIGTQEDDGKYHGLNWNGKILMLVRSHLSELDSDGQRGASVTFVGPSDPLPVPGEAGASTMAKDKAIAKAMETSMKKLKQTMCSMALESLPCGSVIGLRYKVMHAVNTATLGAFVGNYCYVCQDTEPFSESLDRRIRRLLSRSNMWGGLRRQLVNLRRALSTAAVSVAKAQASTTAGGAPIDGAAQVSEEEEQAIRKAWKAVDDQMVDVNRRLFGAEKNSAGDDVWQAFTEKLNSLLPRYPISDPAWLFEHLHIRSSSDGPETFNHLRVTGTTFAAAAAAAHTVERLLSEPEWARSMPIVFLKTFKQPDQTSVWPGESILQEIRVCSTDQPDLVHPNVCGISLASHAAAVEVNIEGYGRLGLRTRMPLVALEYCDGLDLCDFALEGGGALRMVDVLCTVLDAFPIDAGLPSAAGAASAGNGGTIGGAGEHARGGGGDMRLNKALQAAAAYLGDCFISIEALFDLVFTDKSETSVRLEDFVRAWHGSHCRAMAARSGGGGTAKAAGGTAAASTGGGSKPLTTEEILDACRGVRRMLELVHDWRWAEAGAALQHAGIAGGLGLVSSGTPGEPNKANKTSIRRLTEISRRQREANEKFAAALSRLLLNEPLGTREVFDPSMDASYAASEAVGAAAEILKRRKAVLKVEDSLLRHVLTGPPKVRLATGKDPKLKKQKWQRPAPAVIWNLVEQAADAVNMLHKCNIVHADVKLENFVLTMAGQVKLTDFGFMATLDQLDQVPISKLGFKYSSPELREAARAGGLPINEIAEASGCTPADLLKANDVWMLGQMLYKLFCNPATFYAETYQVRGSAGWVATGSGRDVLLRDLENTKLEATDATFLQQILAERILVPLSSRIRNMEVLLQELGNRGGIGSARGHNEVLKLAWPLYIPRPALNIGGSGADAAQRGGAVPDSLFEVDLDYVEIEKGWLIFQVGETLSGVQTDGWEFRVGDQITKIDGSGPGKSNTKRTGPLYSEMEVQVTRAGSKTKADVTLHRVRPVEREWVASDPERFRAYLLDRGFWARKLENRMDSDGPMVNEEELKKEFARWRGYYRCEMSYERMRHAWGCRGWISSDSVYRSTVWKRHS